MRTIPVFATDPNAEQVGFGVVREGADFGVMWCENACVSVCFATGRYVFWSPPESVMHFTTAVGVRVPLPTGVLGCVVVGVFVGSPLWM